MVLRCHGVLRLPCRRLFRGRFDEDFANSTWFTRGWTVQELLAPGDVVFCDAHWNVFGDKHSLVETISQVTGIERRYLTGRGTTHAASIAAKMSWFSARRTTREEDMAYCMLGVFDVNMPLLYGEDEKAFLRLQAEIIRVSNDQSIFAWWGPGEGSYHYADNRPSNELKRFPSGNMLARSPVAFAICGNVRSLQSRCLRYTLVQNGLEVLVPPQNLVSPQKLLNAQYPLPNYRSDDPEDTTLLQLECRVDGQDGELIPCIELSLKPEKHTLGDGRYRKRAIVFLAPNRMRGFHERDEDAGPHRLIVR